MAEQAESASLSAPIRRGAMLRLDDDDEDCPPLVEVTTRFRDIDTDEYHYLLADPTHTDTHRYHHTDVAALFVDTRLTNDRVKPVVDPEIRALFQRLCHHSFRTVHDRDGDRLVPAGEQCISCRLWRADQ